MFPMIVTMVMAKREELFQRAAKSGSAGDVEIFVSSKKMELRPPLCCAGWWLMGMDGD